MERHHREARCLMRDAQPDYFYLPHFVARDRSPLFV
jgi:hypothetical protein